jgi:hypothetical protein
MGVNFLEVGKALKISALLCIPLKNYFLPFRVKAPTLEERQYFAALLDVIYGVGVRKIG